MKTNLIGLTFCACALIASPAIAASAESGKTDASVDIHAVDEAGPGKSLGTVSIAQTAHGLVFTPDLQGLAPGVHGFHIHEKGDCGTTEKDGKKTPAGAAGPHFDPEKSGKHGTPWGEGHLGDLPALYVDAAGKATQPVLAPRLESLSQISGRAIMIHHGGDNHADHPDPLGGGGARVACGVIK